jgi:hypothetical protein
VRTVIAFVLFVSCIDATAIDVNVSTDALCSAEVAIVVAPTLAELANKLAAQEKPSAQKTGCVRPGDSPKFVGDIVLTPASAKNESAAFAVMTRLDGAPPIVCGLPGPPDPQCIIARRSLSFVPHTTLVVNVDLLQSCAGVPCSLDQTCNKGVCAPAGIETGLVGLWRLDEQAPNTLAGGDDFADISGNGHNGIEQNNVSFGVEGKVGLAASFTNGAFVKIGANAPMPTAAVSAAAWVRTDSKLRHYPQIVTAAGLDGLTGYNLYAYNCPGTCGPFYPTFVPGAASFILREMGHAWGECWALGTTDIRDGNWHYVAGTYDGTTTSIYVDGALQGSSTCANQPIDYGVSPEGDIAAKANGEADTPWEGDMQQAAVWNRALTAADVTGLYNGGLGVEFR